jgi:RNA polymerase sigma factor (sigma-70 family)
MRTSERGTTAASGDDALGSELNRALERPLLTPEGERRLARRAAQGDVAARDRLVEGNVRLVVAIARTYRGRGVPHADLVQEGMLALLRAVGGFDPRRGHRLATYATWWIRRSMIEAVVAAPAIRIPSEAGRELAAILRTEQELRTHGRPRPSSGALAARTGVPLRRVDRLRSAPRVVTSLDAEVADSGASLVETIVDPAVGEHASVVERDEARRTVLAALSVVRPRARRVLELRFGLGGAAPSTHEQVGHLLGITAERSRQLEAEGLRRLRPLAERAALSA